KSPDHIASRLALVDQRAINNAADASNYTLWEMGHPTHAFDLDLLQGGRIIVRRARDGETLKTLDGVDRKLSSDDLVIADAGRPVALAGVMGGFDTMITERTKNILIESAWFDPAAVRKTAKRHGLHTDASHRFERGADYGATPLACSLVAQRIIESGAGELDDDVIDAVAREIDQASVVLRISQVHRILGSKLETHEIAESFSSTPVIELANPLSEEASLMRSSLVPGMLNMLGYNLKRGTENVRLCEIGDVYEAADASTVGRRRICLGATARALRHA